MHSIVPMIIPSVGIGMDMRSSPWLGLNDILHYGLLEVVFGIVLEITCPRMWGMSQCRYADVVFIDFHDMMNVYYELMSGGVWIVFCESLTNHLVCNRGFFCEKRQTLSSFPTTASLSVVTLTFTTPIANVTLLASMILELRRSLESSSESECLLLLSLICLSSQESSYKYLRWLSWLLLSWSRPLPRHLSQSSAD